VAALNPASPTIEVHAADAAPTNMAAMVAMPPVTVMPVRGIAVLCGLDRRSVGRRHARIPGCRIRKQRDNSVGCRRSRCLDGRKDACATCG
jgi:hypothetical protein